jgi:subtilisin family serine protease
MVRKMIGILICTLLIITAVLPVGGTFFSNSKDKLEVKKVNTISDFDFAPAEFIVKFREGVTIDFTKYNGIMATGIPSIDNLNRGFKVLNIEQTFLNQKPRDHELFESIGLDRIYTFIVNENVDILNAVEAFENNPYVEYAEPNYLGQGCLMPNDPSFNVQWGLHNTGQTGGTSDADIDGPEAWDIKQGSSNVIIAIVDTGIDYNHVDLNANMWQNPGEIPNNNQDDDSNGFIDDYYGWDFPNNHKNPMDNAGHGTHCAGIAGARSNNNVGIAGAIWNVKLMAVKVAQCSGGGCFDETDCGNGITYAADNGAHIISMSWAFNWNPQVIEDAVDYAYGLGCFMVAAIGNYGSSTNYWPASYNKVMAVGASDHKDNRCTWSNWGSHINVLAPGGRSTTSQGSGPDIYSTLPGDTYGYYWGTSMSTPLVAGLGGLLKAQDLTRTGSEIWTIIVNTCDDMGAPGWDQYTGMGRINAYTALYGAPYKPTVNGPSNGKVDDTLTYTAITWDPNGENIYYWFDWGDGTDSGWKGPYTSGQFGSADHKWSSTGTYTVKAKAKDINNKESEWSDPISVTVPRNKYSQRSQQSSQQSIIQLLQQFPNAFPILRFIFGL